MNRRSIILTLGLLISGYLVFFGEKPQSDVVEPVARTKASSRANASNSNNSSNSSGIVTSKTFNPESEPGSANDSANGSESSSVNKSSRKKSLSSTHVLSVLPREALIEKAPAKPTKPNKVGAIAGLQPNNNIPHEALFDSQTWDPPPPPPPKPGPPPPPVAPPLPYVVIGKKLEDQAWEVYLTRGEQTFIARENLVIENQYRVDSIKPPTMTLTYLPLNQTQTLTIGGND